MQQQNLIKEGLEVDAGLKDYPKRKFKITKKVGQGNQGSIYFAKSLNWNEDSDKQFALKFQDKGQYSIKEMDFLKVLIDYQNSPNEKDFSSNMIKIYDSFEYQTYLVTVMEKGDSDLYNYLNKQRTQISMFDKIKLCYDLAIPIYFLHANGLIHRDIKPENYIMVGDKCKLIDFGLLRKLENNLQMTKNVGSILFCAPEMLDDNSNYTEKVDVWSLACLFYEVFSENPLFNGTSFNEVRNQILNHNKDQSYINNQIKNIDCDDQFKSIMLQMLEYNFKNRLDVKILVDKMKNVLNQILEQTNQNNQTARLHTIGFQPQQPQQPQQNPQFIQPQLPFNIQQQNKFQLFQNNNFGQQQQVQNQQQQNEYNQQLLNKIQELEQKQTQAQIINQQFQNDIYQKYKDLESKNFRFQSDIFKINQQLLQFQIQQKKQEETIQQFMYGDEQTKKQVNYFDEINQIQEVNKNLQQNIQQIENQVKQLNNYQLQQKSQIEQQDQQQSYEQKDCNSQLNQIKQNLKIIEEQVYNLEKDQLQQLKKQLQEINQINQNNPDQQKLLKFIINGLELLPKEERQNFIRQNQQEIKNLKKIFNPY